jgi:multicomponent Na+:H+ antiporter subunit G
MRIVLSSIFLSGGLFFFMVGTIGLLRFPDMLTRAHAAAKCDTLGAMLSLLGLIVFSGFNTISLKLMLILLFIWITNPTGTHLIAKARYDEEVNNYEDI